MDEHNTNDEGSKSENSDGEKKNKGLTGRFAKRIYRRRNDSQSSTSSVPMGEPASEQNNAERGTNSNQHNQEVCKSKLIW